MESEKKDIAMWVMELEAKVQALEAERDRLYALLGKCVVTDQQVHTDETIKAWDELQVMYDEHQAIGGGDE